MFCSRNVTALAVNIINRHIHFNDKIFPENEDPQIHTNCLGFVCLGQHAALCW